MSTPHILLYPLILGLLALSGCGETAKTPVLILSGGGGFLANTDAILFADNGPTHDTGAQPDGETPDSAAPDSAAPDSATQDTTEPDGAVTDTAQHDTQSPDALAGYDTQPPDAGPISDDGTCPQGCSDGLTCTLDGCKNGGCSHQLAPGYCLSGGSCIAAGPVTGSPCLSCQPQVSLLTLQPVVGAACDDGVACTTVDTCVAGSCEGNVQACACLKDADCPDDGNFCNGAAYCDTVKEKCVINPASVVACVTVKDTACVKNRCDPTTGSCALSVVPSGAPCDDAYACTTGDTCKVGICTPGKFTCECKGDADCQDDGDLCNGVPFCNLATGKCALNPATTVVCPSVADSTCMASVCEPQTGTCALIPVNQGTLCSDGNICTVDETCKQGACASATNVCVCNTDADCAAKEDGDACNGTLFCDKSVHQCVLNPSTVVTCQTVDNTPCAKTTCNPTTGVCALTASQDNTACSDGDPCGAGASCLKGACVASTPQAPSQCSCGSDKDCAKFEDGDLCNGTLICDLAKKRCSLDSQTVVTCSESGDACTQNTCNAQTGVCAVAAVVDGAACTLSAPCVKTAACQTGVCKLATKLVCDDGNPCTTGTCVAGGGCSFTPVNSGANVPCYSGPSGTLGVGICKSGTTTCGDGGTANPCVGEQLPKSSDVCGGGNEDCDALTDEDCGDLFKLSLVCGDGQRAKPGQPLSEPFRVVEWS